MISPPRQIEKPREEDKPKSTRGNHARPLLLIGVANNIVNSVKAVLETDVSRNVFKQLQSQ
jgi:hypothetical protein